MANPWDFRAMKKREIYFFFNGLNFHNSGYINMLKNTRDKKTAFSGGFFNKRTEFNLLCRGFQHISTKFNISISAVNIENTLKYSLAICSGGSGSC